ncbi:TdeIII family type II restriction endonuclease [Helicobacter cetorum]|uniref:TdeIII family type II restriction endonuclease n=1 Tax=Helicobacter cetorum TaxID=138563 RepID=UPI000CF152A1|nr:TdeIII family type II restriction endonuclease [Helicobacter cetorum]
MTLNESVKEKIAIEVIKTLVSRFDNFPNEYSLNRNAPFHTAFLNAFKDEFCTKASDMEFFISLSSWMHGFNTTLGQSFFENIAHHISNGEKREYTSKRLGNLKISQTQRSNIAQIIANLSTSAQKPDLEYENKLLFCDYDDSKIDAMDFSADIFIEDDNAIYAIELKSVKPNSGEMRGEKQKILEGKAALFKKFPHKEIKFYIGFPFDPTINPKTEKVSGFNKDKFLKQIINMTKYFDKQEILVAQEFWDLLSGEKETMEQILEIINRISTTDFMNNYCYLMDTSNRSCQKYQEILKNWFLISELELVQNDSIIKERIRGNQKLTGIYNKQIFENNGSKKGVYRFDRYNELKGLV